ncbi:MAG TPA: UPF0182 family protein, partial [Gemmatimonadales bacterium]|nr:UPF0182 family protein [Gemmatimonadales bacterium]
MTRRARNVAGAVLLLVLALYGGKWLTGFLTIRWWAAAFSPDAVTAVTRWRLLGLGLDSIAVAVASIWFVAQVWMVKATINAIHVRRELDDRVEWHPVPERMMVQGAVALGVLLGLLTGSGAGSGVGQVALPIGAPRFGIEDISTGLDLGSLVSWYPVLLQIQRFLLTLGLIGLAISLLLYLLLDSAAGKPFRPVLRQERRLHYSLSLTVIALALVLGALLIPLHLGTSVDAPTGDTAGTVRLAAGYALAGVAAASALLTLWWGVSTARHTVLISTWIVLAVAELTGRVLVPALTADSGSGVERARLMRQLDSLMYGIRLRDQTAAEDSLPATATIWDPDLLAAGRATEFLLGAGPSGSDTAAAWLVATRSEDESTIDVRKVSAFEVDRHGAPIEIGAPRRIASNRAIPGEDGWKQVEHGGVRVGGVLRRLAIAWALQAPGILSLPRDTEIDWWLDPRDRARALVPALEWRAVGATMSNGDLVWILAGMSTLERA